MEPINSLERLHQFRHWTVRQDAAEVVEIPPFAFHLGGDATPRSGTALPLTDAPKQVEAAVVEMRRRVATRGGAPRVEVIEDLFPGVTAALTHQNFPIVE